MMPDTPTNAPLQAASGAFGLAAAAVRPVDDAAAADAQALSDRQTKPRGALGLIEHLGCRLAAISGAVPPPVPEPVAVGVFAGDHGVLAQGVTPWPGEVTGQMVLNFLAGGAAVNVLARHAGADVEVVDVGIASDLPPEAESAAMANGARLVRACVRRGTGDLAVEPAMTIDEARTALDVGAATAARLIGRGARGIAMGEMGIGNTTPSAALIAAFTGQSAAAVTGRGTGVDDPMLATKVAVVQRGLDRATAEIGDLAAADPTAVLAQIGGLEIAALAGFIVGGAAARVPVIVDGVIACAAALVAVALVPDTIGYLIAGHRSSEPGATVALAHLGLDPVLDLGLRLGEGSGATLAIPIVQAAAKILAEMATFDQAGVSDKEA